MSGKNAEFYKGKLILAPMVRASSFALRKTALDYGADLVFTEEIVDKRFLRCRRIENVTTVLLNHSDLLGTIDFVVDGDVVLRTVPSDEKDKLVFQMGTNSASAAVEVVKSVENDVSAVDVNMGCPKQFSMHSGMGAALLNTPEKVKRLEDSLALCQTIEKAGASAIAIHGRRVEERPKNANRNSEIAEISRQISIPIIANGGSREIAQFSDIEKFKKATNTDSVMIARAALENASIFCPQGVISSENVARKYLKYVLDYDFGYIHTKYVLQRMLKGDQSTTQRGRDTVAAVCMRDVCKAWDMVEYYKKFENCPLLNGTATAVNSAKRPHSDGNSPILETKSTKYEENGVVAEVLNISLAVKRLKQSEESPKIVLYLWCKRTKLAPPKYNSERRPTDHRWIGEVVLDGKKYMSPIGQPNKKAAEQLAALVALYKLDLRHLLTENWEL